MEHGVSGDDRLRRLPDDLRGLQPRADDDPAGRGLVQAVLLACGHSDVLHHGLLHQQVARGEALGDRAPLRQDVALLRLPRLVHRLVSVVVGIRAPRADPVPERGPPRSPRQTRGLGSLVAGDGELAVPSAADQAAGRALQHALLGPPQLLRLVRPRDRPRRLGRGVPGAGCRGHLRVHVVGALVCGAVPGQHRGRADGQHVREVVCCARGVRGYRDLGSLLQQADQCDPRASKDMERDRAPFERVECVHGKAPYPGGFVRACEKVRAVEIGARQRSQLGRREVAPPAPECVEERARLRDVPAEDLSACCLPCVRRLQPTLCRTRLLRPAEGVQHGPRRGDLFVRRVVHRHVLRLRRRPAVLPVQRGHRGAAAPVGEEHRAEEHPPHVDHAA
mmetsp:Transcript_68008/g.208427  ORF Transcript_68008/g.208427 Transcript_68008/m.208427 type:complete len:392 (+) Transcript_68008:1043-2218(+)